MTLEGNSMMTNEAKGNLRESDESRSLTRNAETVLVVEDEEMLRDFLQTVLSENGYKVLMAANGADAIRSYKSHIGQIALVLLDMGLPEIGGEDVLSAILTLDPKAKLIAISGSVDPGSEADALDKGARSYLHKPYLIEQLLEKINKISDTRVRTGS